jgi:1-acyl-sn-glycerol-3-phosphate acyltransferase
VEGVGDEVSAAGAALAPAPGDRPASRGPALAATGPVAPGRVFVHRADPLYRLLRWLSRWAVRWTFREATYEGTWQLPATGPVLLVVNHPNELPDILLTFGVTPRPIHFVGAIAHARVGYVRWALTRIGAVFVHRPQEAAVARLAGGDASAANREAMEGMLAVLRAGGVLAIFPEGGVRRETPIGRLQPGVAALALRAVREAGIDALRLVPVGIGYAAPDTPRDRVCVTVGAPLDVAAWCAARGADADAGAPSARAELTALLGTIREALARCAAASRAAVGTPVTPALRSRGWLVAWAPIALVGAVTHLPAFVATRAVARRTMADTTDYLGRLAVPGVFVVLAWYALLVALAVWAVVADHVPLPLALGLVAALPLLGWRALTWHDAWHDRRTA